MYALFSDCIEKEFIFKNTRVYFKNKKMIYKNSFIELWYFK